MNILYHITRCTVIEAEKMSAKTKKSQQGGRKYVGCFQEIYFCLLCQKVKKSEGKPLLYLTQLQEWSVSKEKERFGQQRKTFQPFS